MPRVLIIGFGNPLRGDDGFGYRAAERLRGMVDDPDVEILASHQLTPELMEPLSRAGRAIFIDACIGPVPGELTERRLEAAAAAAASFTHHLTPEALLAGARALYGRAAWGMLVTCAGTDFSCSDELSPVVLVSLDHAITSVLRHASARCKLP